MKDDRDHFTYVQYLLLFCQVFETLLKNSHNICQSTSIKKIHVSHMLQLQQHV